MMQRLNALTVAPAGVTALRAVEQYVESSGLDPKLIVLVKIQLIWRQAVRQFQRKERIGASIHRVWAILADVKRWPQWTASVTRIEELNPCPLGLGSRVRIHQPKLRPAVWVVTAWEPESCFVWETAGHGVTLVGSHILTACEEGCEVTLGLRFDGWLGGLAARLKGRIAERYVRCEAEGLKVRSCLPSLD
jgi:Polyketide cyclase / dehydrase and lipid transport